MNDLGSRRERRRARSAFPFGALTFGELFAGLPPAIGDQTEILALGGGLKLWQDAHARPGQEPLCFSCVFSLESSAGGQPLRRTAEYEDVLALLYAGRHTLGTLELVLAPAEATGQWSIEKAERVIFTAEEWRLTGWEHWSLSKRARSTERFDRLGWEGDWALFSITLQFRLAPKVPDPQRRRVIGARALLTVKP